MRLLTEWVLTSVFLILAVAALRALLGRRVRASLRYALWAVVLVRLLVPVQLFSYPVPAAVLPGLDREQIIETTPPSLVSAAPGVTAGTPAVAGPVPDGVVVNHGTVPTPPAPKAGPLPVLQVLGWLWLAGSAAMAAAFIISNLKFARRLRRVRVPLEAADCPLPVYIAQGLPSPCLFGLVCPAVYVTPEAADDPLMLRHVLAHEYTHFRHGDHVWNILRSIALAVHWWNPLVWLAVVLSRRDCERACDEGALKRLGDGERVAYGRTLLALLTVKPRPGDLLTCATTMTGGQKSVFDRVTRIAHAPKRWLWAAVVAVLAAALACVCAFGAAEPETEDGPEPSSDPPTTGSPTPVEPVQTPAAVGEGLDFEFYSVNDGIVRFNDLTWVIASTRTFTFQVEQYAILDLDGDGQTELVLEMEGQGGFYIFRKMDNWLYGFWERSRGLQDLKADGTFCGSSGAADWGYYTVSAFTHSGMEHARFTWCESAENYEELYFVDGAPAVQREFEAAVAVQAAKEDAPWRPWVGYPGYPAEAKEWLDAAGVTWLERTWSWGSIRDWDGTLEDWEREKEINYQFSRQDIDSAIAAARAMLEEWASEEWVISFEINDVYEARMQTLHDWYRYFESTSALFTDWTKEDMETRYIVIGADYTCEYDHTRTFLFDGPQRIAIMLTRPAGGEWSVWDTGDLSWYDSAAPAEEVDSLPFDGPMKLMFASGAGGWSTDLTLYPDGSFEGDYHDMDMGVSGPGYQSTEYVCQFHGQFGDIQQVTDASWSMALEELVIDTGHPIGEEWIEEKRIEPSRYTSGGYYNQRYISSGPYGMCTFDKGESIPLEPGAQFMFYTPDAKGYAPGDELYGMQDSDDYNSIMCQFWSWWPDKHAWDSPDATLGCYGLCNIERGCGFFDLEAWGISSLT